MQASLHVSFTACLRCLEVTNVSEACKQFSRNTWKHIFLFVSVTGKHVRCSVWLHVCGWFAFVLWLSCCEAERDTERKKMGRPFSTVFSRYVSDLSSDHKYGLSAWHPPLFLSSFPPARWECVWEQVFDVEQCVRQISFTWVYHTLLCPSCHTIIIFLPSCHSSTCSPHARSIASEWFSGGSSHPVLMRSACRTTP